MDKRTELLGLVRNDICVTVWHWDTMIYGVVVKDLDYSMSMGGRYALRRPCQATLGPIRTERAGVEIPA